MTCDDPGLAALSGLGDPVRRRLYEFVSTCGEPVGREEAAAAAGVRRSLAAYHLDKLVELGLLTASYQRPADRGGPGAGRPAKVYTRSESEFTVSVPPREYELAAHLLAAAVESEHGGTCRGALLAAAEQFGADTGERASTGQSGGASGEHAAASQRERADARQAILSVLRAHGFEPRVDAAGAIRLHNCPFHQLAARHPGLVCGMNLALIKGLADRLSAGALHPVLAPQPGCCCVVIGTSQSAGEPRRPALS